MDEKSLFYCFGDWRFDPISGDLVGPSVSRRLAPKPALVLQTLLETPKVVVTRERLKHKVWPNTVVDFDRNLNFCIREIRSALGDCAASPIYIETCARRGYRFLLRCKETSLRLDSEAPQWMVLLPTFLKRKPFRYALVALALVIGLSAIPSLEVSFNSRFADIPDRESIESAEMGGYLLTRGEPGDVERSIEFFRAALTSNPTYARAYAGLGAALIELGHSKEGEEALHESLTLDSDQWAVHITLARHALYNQYNRSRAAYHFERAITLEPDHVIVRHTYSWYAAMQGRFDEAIGHMKAALDLDPVSPRVNSDVGRLFYLTGHYDEAIAQCKRAVKLTRDSLLHDTCLMHALAEMESSGRTSGTTRHLGTSEEASDLSAPEWHRLATRLDAASEVKGISPVYAAAAWARAGRKEHAMDRLERAIEQRCPMILEAAVDPAYRVLGSAQRFRRILQRIGAQSAVGA